MTGDELKGFFYEIFDASLPRLGPGDDASTRRALAELLAAGGGDGDGPGPAKLKALDLGCGNGAQTIELAKCLDGTIWAVDNHGPYLEELRRRAETRGVADKIKPRQGDMADLGLDEGSFELIWSEGALYNVGFGRGLAICRELLVPGGLLAASELTWLRPDPPDECRAFFADEYPAMVDVAANLTIIREAGCELLGHFTLPESAWLDSYYLPLEARLGVLRERYAGDGERMGMIDSVQREIDIYRQYLAYYGYEFFLMRRG